MSEGTLASAVAVPDQDSIRQSPEYPKRRKSSVTDHEPKRRRLSAQDESSLQSHQRRPSSTPVVDETEGTPPQRVRREEDRKRGKRLFGALLGTLSQSSNSAAQKRREDIEKRQQDKLKNQADEYDGLKKKRKERRETIRMKEKPFYEREAMQTRHAHMLASARFLKTRAQPVLYYKPWQPRRGDDDIIKEQIKEAESKIASEIAEFEHRYPPEAFAREELEPLSTSQPEEQEPSQNAPAPDPAKTESSPDTDIKTSQNDNSGKAEEQHKQDSVPIKPEESVSAEGTTSHEDHDIHRDDDGGEVVEDNEDTVIY